MLEFIFFIMDLVDNNNITKEKIASVIYNVYKGETSNRNIEKIAEDVWGESIRMKKVLSRDYLISKGISEENVDYVIKEIRLFIGKIHNIDELRSQCGYEDMELADFLWHEYCNLNKGKEIIECEADLRTGLFVIAKAWIELADKEPIIEFFKRIDSKTRRILLGEEELKTDTKEIKQDVKETNCKIDAMDQKIEILGSEHEGINSGVNEMNHKADKILSILNERYISLANKSEKEEQISDGQAEQNSREADDERITLPTENASEQEVVNSEEISMDEIKICIAAASDEFQKEIDSLKEFIEEQNQYQNAVRLKLQCYDGEVSQDLQQYKYCYILVGAKMEMWMQEAYELVCGLSHNEASDAECVKLRLFFKKLSDGETMQDDNSCREELKNRYRNDFNRNPFDYNDINRIKLDILQNLRIEEPDVYFSTQSIKQFLNNKDFEEAYKKREDLQEQYKDVSGVFDTDKSPKEKNEIESLEAEIEEQNEIVENMEKDIWDNLNLLTDKLQNKSAMDAREVEAIESIIEYGNYENADILLRSTEWNQEIVALEQAMKEKQEVLRRFISAQRTLIANLKTKGISSSLENEIIEIYERITELSKEWHVEYITLYEFAEFLLNQRKYSEGIKIGEELRCLYGLSGGTLAEDKIRLLNLLGDLYFEVKEYKSSERII